MAPSNSTVDRLVADVTLLGTRGLSRHEYFAEVAARLRRVVDNAATCWHTLDPYTHLLTGDSPAEMVERGLLTPAEAGRAGEVIVRSEYLLGDANGFADLARRRVPVNTLAAATRGRPETVARYRDLLAPAGMPHELRAAFPLRGRVWGAVHVARREGEGEFTADDVAVMARLTGIIAAGIRTSLRFEAARRQAASSPGLVIVGPGGEVELITPPAQALLAGVRGPATDAADLPAAVSGLAAYAAQATSEEVAAGALVVTMPAADGWITLHASRPDPAGRRVAIVVEDAAGPRLATLRMDVYGATAREREVATLLARGLSTADIAAVMVVSPHTVQDHVKNLFEKLGVASRQELVARVFLDEYAAEIAGGTPIASHGRFDEVPAPLAGGAARAG